jgi:phage shock protein A
MDLDAVVKKYHNRITALEQFVFKDFSPAADGEAKMDETSTSAAAADQPDVFRDLLAFKAEVEQTLPLIRKAVMDAQGVVAEFNQIVTAFQPTFAWVQSQIAAEEARKANREAAVAAGEHVEERAPEVGPGNAVDHQGAQTA